ncbi:trypsin, alkaline A-like [Pararge aegeria]|uniref:trypsin, alkaline A-like n=1 Tax=Pararge aegeria TaxID=116150 RepID=UPI0019D1DCF5|nr:trypsin, alkaline A-like [Pararge aegeria]
MKMLIILTVICGIIANINAQSRIAGGELADITKYPFAVALLSNIESPSFLLGCGGTILTNTAILTAASCFFANEQITQPSSWRARVGSSSLTNGGTLYIISRITTHPLFSMNTLEHNVAVIRTVVAMSFSTAVQPAYIAGGAYRLQRNDEVVAIGWGATSVTGSASPDLRRVQIWVNDQQTCVERYYVLNFNVTDSMLCAGWLDVGIRGQCLGDNGGPLLHNGVVVGVYSWSQGCGDIVFPNINTRVSHYSRWIEAIATA